MDPRGDYPCLTVVADDYLVYLKYIPTTINLEAQFEVSTLSEL